MELAIAVKFATLFMFLTSLLVLITNRVDAAAFCPPLLHVAMQFSVDARETVDIVYVTADDLKPYGNNPRRNDDAVDAVAESIKEFGFKVPIVVSSDMTIVTGHTRLKATRRLGMKEVPCIIADADHCGT